MHLTEAVPARDRTLEAAARLTDRLAPWALGSVLAAFTLLDYSAGRHGAAEDLAIALFAAGAGGAAATARRRRWPLFAVTAVGAFLFSCWPAFLVASYYAATTTRRGAHLAAFAGTAAAALLAVPVAADILGTGLVLGPEDRMSAGDRVFSVLFLVGLPLAVGLWINARRQVLAALAERAGRLEREQAARAEQARAAERARIAREMHDVVAHKVSLVVLHAGALQSDAADEDTRRAADLIRATGREALANLREVLGVLRAAHAEPRTPPPALSDLERLLAQSRAAGLTVRRRDEGAARPLPDAAERAAYRVVQEALTNVHKHAAGAAAEVVLRHRPGHLEVTVHNGPAEAAPDLPPGGGLGLAGLRERLALLGGTLEAGPRPDGGFAVRARVPAVREPS
ncbi:sensor histidine kinase [Actinomadura roseirufa]|uniref:sensor histidine kinase n=1 Tax=Actinomadura roseirufa TaxID=2094049 RepID=UPI001F5E38DF|nr:sensor histidine kinase [Actinomadura roseirufa]